MRKIIFNQYRTELGRKVWGTYSRGDRTFGTRHNLMAHSARPDRKTTAVMACVGGGNQINLLVEIFEK